jgi:hypothetical protein
MNFSFAGSIAKVGALVWCPTNFQHTRFNFYVDEQYNILARLMGLSVTLRTPPQAQIYFRALNTNNKEAKLGSIGHLIWARIFGRHGRSTGSRVDPTACIAASEQ